MNDAPRTLTPSRLDRWRRIVSTYRAPADEHRHFLVFITMSGLDWERLEETAAFHVRETLLIYLLHHRPSSWPDHKGQWDEVPGQAMFCDLVVDHLPPDLAAQYVLIALLGPVDRAMRSEMATELLWHRETLRPEIRTILRMLLASENAVRLELDRGLVKRLVEIFASERSDPT